MKSSPLKFVTMGLVSILLITACEPTETPEVSETNENLYTNSDLDFSYEVPEFYVENNYRVEEKTREIEGGRTWEEVSFLVDFEAWPNYRFISIGRMEPEIKDFISQKAAETPEADLSEFEIMNDTFESLGEHDGYWYYYDTYNQDIPLELSETDYTFVAPESLIKIGL